jgi:hypothetical protein
MTPDQWNDKRKIIDCHEHHCGHQFEEDVEICVALSDRQKFNRKVPAIVKIIDVRQFDGCKEKDLCAKN